MIELNFPNAVRDEKHFYGRKSEVEQIERAFLNGRRLISIRGQRRIGKTSLQTITAQRLVAQAPARFVCVQLPPAPAIRSLDDYAKEILQCLCSQLDKNLRETGLLNAQGQFELPVMGQFADVVMRLLPEDFASQFILCIDEFDAILIEYAKAEAHGIVGLTDFIVEHSELPILISLTMTHWPDDLTTDYYAPLITRNPIIDLGPLSQGEMEVMVHGLLGQAALNPPTMERLFKASGGHPYFVKLFLELLLRPNGSEQLELALSSSLLEQIIADAVTDSRARHVLENIYKVHFTQAKRQLVLLLAERSLDVTGAGIAPGELDKLGNAYKRAARDLEQYGYLKRDHHGVYSFRLAFLGQWLRDWEEYEEECDRLGLEQLRHGLEVEIEIDETTRKVFLKGRLLNLTGLEYQLLVFLCHAKGQLVEKDTLAEEVWMSANGGVSDAAIDATVYRLRGKLGDNARQPRYIETEAGHGFILRRAGFKP